MDAPKTIVVCSQCQQKLKAPTDRGELKLTCPKCHASWTWSPPESNFKSDFQKAMGLVLKPLINYWWGLSKVNQLDELAIHLKKLSPMAPSLIQYILGSALVTAIVARVINYKEGSMYFVDMPIINEILVIAVFLLGGFICAMLYHKPLMILGGQGNFVHTLNSSMFVAVTFLPGIVLLEGVYLNFTDQIEPSITYGCAAGQMYYLALLLGKVHDLSFNKVYWMLGLVILLTIFVMAFGMIMFF